MKLRYLGLHSNPSRPEPLTPVDRVAGTTERVSPVYLLDISTVKVEAHRGSADRVASIMSSNTSSRSSQDETARLYTSDELPPEYSSDVEKGLQTPEPVKDNKGRQFLVWTVINTLATIAIVSSVETGQCTD